MTTLKITKEQLSAAKDAIKIRAKINRLQDDLDDILVDLLMYSNGKSYTIPVPDKGSVQIVAATEEGLSSGKFDYIFNKDKFLEMTDAMKRKLARDGVVKLIEKLSSARRASIRIALNK